MPILETLAIMAALAGKAMSNRNKTPSAPTCVVRGCSDPGNNVTMCCGQHLCDFHCRVWKEHPAPCPCRG